MADFPCNNPAPQQLTFDLSLRLAQQNSNLEKIPGHEKSECRLKPAERMNFLRGEKAMDGLFSPVETGCRIRAAPVKKNERGKPKAW